jgi:DNA-binding MarR family transcriptional regulator
MYMNRMKPTRPTTGSLVWHLAMRWRNEVDRAVSPLGLTHAQYSALASLHSLADTGIAPSQRELADYTGLQPIYVSKLVRSLEQSGHLLRETHGIDSRAVALQLTPAGLKTVVEARRIVEALDRRLTEPLGGPDSDQTRALAGSLRLLLDYDRTPEE